MEEMTREELLRRRLWGLYLTRKGEPQEVAGGLCGLQAQYAANAVHALRIRCGSTDTKGLVKGWTLRGTMHLFPADDLSLYLPEGRLDFFDTPYGRWRYDHGCPVSRERMGFFARVVEGALSDVPISREELKALCRAEGMTAEEEPWVFDGWGGVIRMLAEGGALCVSAEENRAYVSAPEFVPMNREQAERELLRRHLTAYGPVSLRDMAYFFRWTQKQLKALLSELPAETVTCEGRTYYYIGMPSSLPPVPRCLFAAGFDPLLLGYEKTENPVLPPEHLKKIFNNTGIVFPALLVEGAVCGKWKEQPKRIEITAFAPLDEAAVLNEAAGLWLGKPVKFL